VLAGACIQDNPAYDAGMRDSAVPLELGPSMDVGPSVDQGRDVFDAGAESAGPKEPSVDAAVFETAPPISAQLVLHWRFDETTGAVAADSSGNGLDGTYTGGPVPVSGGAPTTFANPGSRQFRAEVMQSVQLGRSAPALQPAAGLTVSVWFRTSLTGRADFLGHGNDYFLRIMSGEIEFVRRRPTGSSPDIYITATGAAPKAADGQWHHALGVATTGRIAMYLDGALIARKDEIVPFVYLAQDFVVGRAANAALSFAGTLDDVRIYGRALAEDEIRVLAARAP